MALLAYLKMRRRFDPLVQTQTRETLGKRPSNLSRISRSQRATEQGSPLEDFRLRYPAKFRTEDGHYVRSKSELIIDNWLHGHRIPHEYEKQIPNEFMTCDFHLPDHDIYIEFWGGGTPDYDKRKDEKIKLYGQLGLRLVSLEDTDIEHLERRLAQKLRRFGIII